MNVLFSQKDNGSEVSHAAPGDSSRSPPALAVTRMVVSQFRNYQHAEIRLRAAPVVLTGANGAGKTNLLEAVSYLGPGRGLRSARLSDVARIGWDGGWSVSASLSTPDGPRDIATGTASHDLQTERRAVKIDGIKLAGPGKLAELSRIIWLTPRMDRLFVDAPSGRRRFLDRLTIGMEPGHGRHLSAYERALRERMMLLRQGKGDDAWLSALEAGMAEHGTAMAAARRETLARLRGALSAGAGPFPSAEAQVSGIVEDWLEEMPALQAEEAFRVRLARLRPVDAEAGKATAGPHTSDFKVRHLAKNMPAEQCSTGEQKTLLIAIVLANARLQTAMKGSAPLLLLDEIAAHLDDRHRVALFDEISQLGAQAWITGTDEKIFESLMGRAQFITVKDGAIGAD